MLFPRQYTSQVRSQPSIPDRPSSSYRPDLSKSRLIRSLRYGYSWSYTLRLTATLLALRLFDSSSLRLAYSANHVFFREIPNFSGISRLPFSVLRLFVWFPLYGGFPYYGYYLRKCESSLYVSTTLSFYWAQPTPPPLSPSSRDSWRVWHVR